MELVFHAFEALEPGARWAQLFERHWPSYRSWFLQEGDDARPSYIACVRALREHMPELVPTYERMVELAGGSDSAARFLSLYRPTPYLTGCSQAVWLRDEPLLVRNYDYSPRLWDAVLMHTAWNGRHVIAMSDCLWGVLDGINDAGLAVSLAFGGRRAVGDGFGIPLVLRYVLEFCESTPDAVEALTRIPSHMAYNVTVVDRAGRHATVFVGPDRPATVTRRRVATNHQRRIEWRQYTMATASVEREHFLATRIDDPDETVDRFVARFLEPPLFSTRFEHGWGTLYTASYHPAAGQAVYRWPRHAMTQSFDAFQEVALAIVYQQI